MLLAFLVVASHHHHFLTYTIATHTRRSQDKKMSFWISIQPNFNGYWQSHHMALCIIWLYIAVYCQLSSNIQISMDTSQQSYHITTALHSNALPASIDSKALGTFMRIDLSSHTMFNNTNLLIGCHTIPYFLFLFF